VQIGTTKGTGGDILILEEAAYCDEGFFYETVAPILSVGSASLVAISTLTSEINFYTRLIKMIDPCTGRACFTTRCIELVCAQCKESGKSHECVHMLHLVPRWQSAEKHRKLKIMMQVGSVFALRACCVADFDARRTARTSSAASSPGWRSRACSRSSGSRTSTRCSRRRRCRSCRTRTSSW
jgi:hypothetical protein